MFTSIREVKKQFMSIFAGADFASGLSISASKVIPVRSAKVGGVNYAQEKRESYPIISIQDYNPTFSEKYHNDVFNYKVVGKNVVSVEGESRKAVMRPSFMMDFRFDIHTATKNQDEQDEIRMFFLNTFGKRGTINFNQYEDFSYPYDTLKLIPCYYTVARAEVIREDGLYEDNYEFTVECNINSASPELVELVEQLNLILTSNSEGQSASLLTLFPHLTALYANKLSSINSVISVFNSLINTEAAIPSSNKSLSVEHNHFVSMVSLAPSLLNNLITELTHTTYSSALTPEKNVFPFLSLNHVSKVSGNRPNELLDLLIAARNELLIYGNRPSLRIYLDAQIKHLLHSYGDAALKNTFIQVDISSIVRSFGSNATILKNLTALNNHLYNTYGSNISTINSLQTRYDHLYNFYGDVPESVFSFDPEYQAVLNYATAQGFGLPSPAWQLVENQMMINLKASGAFAKMVYFRNYRGDGSLDYKCINWKSPGIYNATRVNSLVVNNNLGFASDGTSYIMTGVSQLADVLPDLKIGFYGGFNTELAGTANDFSFIMGGQSSFSIAPYNLNGNPRAWFNALENDSGGIVLTSGRRSGVHIVHRNGSNDYTWWINGVKAGEKTNYTFTRYFARDLVELALNRSSTIGSPQPIQFFTDPLALSFLGNQALSDTEKIALSSAITNYMSNTL